MKQFFFAAFLLAGTVCCAQKPVDWIKNFNSKVDWYKITDAGVLVVGTGDALYGISPTDGHEVWKKEDIENIREENYDPIEGTPYIVLAKRGLMKSNNKIIDVVTGRQVANTQELGLMAVTKRIYLMKSNAVLFYGIGSTGKPTLMKVSLADGARVWEQQKLFEKNSEQIVSEAGETADGLFIATNRNIYKLNPLTGDVLYSIDMKSDLPVAAPKKEEKKSMFSLPKFGKALDGGANEQATLTSAEFFQQGDNSIIYFWNQDILTAFAVADGKETWKRLELPSPVTNILFDKRGMIIATAEQRKEDMAKAARGGLFGKIAKGKNRASLLLVDPVSGAQKWDSDVDLQGDVMAYKLSDNKLILATERDKGDNYISIINLEEGKSVTKKPLSIKGEIRDLQVVPQGLYYRTAEQINILNLDNGDKTWKKGFSVKNCSGANQDGKTGYVYANNILYKLDFEKGDLTEWITNLKFDGGEEPSSVQVRDNGILLTSDQNVRLYSFDGKQLWHTYKQAPGRTMAGKMLSGLGGLASSMVAAQQAAQAAQLSYAKGYYGSTDAALDSDIKNANANASNFAGAASSSFASISRRFKATREANNYMAILTNFGNSNMAKDAGVMMVNKNDGTDIRRILFGEKKDPDYKLDELGRTVYYKADGNEIRGFAF